MKMRYVVLPFALVAACTKSASKSAADAPTTPAAAAQQAGASGSGSGFANGGGLACEKYLTPDVIAAILNGAPGERKKLSPQSCSVTTTDDAGNLTITLTNATPQGFDAYQKYLVDPQPLSGVGDRAVQSMIGISSIKGNNMGCDIDAGGAPGSLKLRGKALGDKLGAICNKIFADAR
jgi:hypothetical protein